MTTNISPNDYCDNPEDYKNAPLDDKTRAFWDDYCATRKAVQDMPPPNATSFGEGTEEGIKEFILSFLQPQTIGIMGAIMGVPIVYRYVLKNMVGTLFKDLALTEAEQALAKEAVESGMDVSAVNGSVLMTKIFGNNMSYLSKPVAESAGYAGRYGFEALSNISEFLEGAFADFIGGVGIVMMVLQITSMIIDAWDPCHLKAQMSADTLHLFSNMFNDAFRDNVLISLESSQDSYGHVTVNTLFPVEYYAENSALIPFKNDYYDKLLFSLQTKYLNSLQFNSDGLPIKRSSDISGLITNNSLQNAGKLFQAEIGVINTVSNGNTVVENWLFRWWPLIIGIIGIVILTIIFMKRKG